MATKTAYWTLVPCVPTVAADNSWTAGCALTEGYSDEEHSHWMHGSVELMTTHRAGAERMPPTCVVREIGG